MWWGALRPCSAVSARLAACGGMEKASPKAAFSQPLGRSAGDLRSHVMFGLVFN